MTRLRSFTPILTTTLIAAALAAACSDDEGGGKKGGDTDGGADDAGSGGKGSGGKGSGGKGSGGKGSGGKGSGGAATGGRGSGGAATGGRASGGVGGGGASAGGGSGDGGSSSGGSTTDGGDGGPDGGAEMAVCAGKVDDELVACGKYIVEHIDACADCHSPVGPTGIDTTRLLAGNPSLLDLDPDPGVGNIPAPNLTQLKNKGWTSDDIVTAIRDGRSKSGAGLFPMMPYPTFHNMALIDAQAIAAYILSLDPIVHDFPVRQPLPAPFDTVLPMPAYPLAGVPDPVGVPAADMEEAMLGKYLAGQLGPCLECHTKRTPEGMIDQTKVFAGGEPFPSALIGLPVPPFPETIYSLNITPDPTGIAGWEAADVIRVLREGKDKAGNLLCPPMPFGPMGAFGGMTDEHAQAIATYITHLPPIENGLPDGGVFPLCIMPGPPPGDAGPSDSGTPPADASQTD